MRVRVPVGAEAVQAGDDRLGDLLPLGQADVQRVRAALPGDRAHDVLGAEDLSPGRRVVAGRLDEQAIEFFVNGVTAGTIPDYQASALLMAIFFNGMTAAETASLT